MLEIDGAAADDGLNGIREGMRKKDEVRQAT